MARGPRGGALVVRAGDRVLADLSIGWEDRLRRWRRETQALGFSATKGLAAMVLHRLVDRGELTYDEPVASFWPSSRRRGRAGSPYGNCSAIAAGSAMFRPSPTAPTTSWTTSGWRNVAAAAPPTPPGQPAYHAFTFGWLAAGLARAITGKGMRDRPSELAEPLQDPGLEIGSSAGPPGRARRLVSADLHGARRGGDAAAGLAPSRKQGFGPCMRPDSSGSVAARTPRSGGLRCLP